MVLSLRAWERLSEDGKLVLEEQAMKGKPRKELSSKRELWVTAEWLD